MLPKINPDVSSKERYQRIHEILKPALWFVGMDNPHHLEIIQRDCPGIVDLARYIIHDTVPHSSFIYQTKDWPLEKLQNELCPYLMHLAHLRWHQEGFLRFPTESVRIITQLIFEREGW